MEVIFFFLSIVAFIFFVYYAKKKSLCSDLYILHKKAYKKYQKEVISEQKSYYRYVVDFCNDNIFIHDGKSEITLEQLNEKNMNYHIVSELLQERRDLVIKYFDKEHFSCKDFQELNKEFNTTQIESLDKNDSKTKEKEKNFHCKFDDDEIGLLTCCINEARIFTETVTPETVKHLFECTLSNPLQVSNNRLLAYFFASLDDRSLITHNWQSVCKSNNLFISLNGKPLNQSDLSSATNIIRDKEWKDTEIIDKYLKKLKKH